jgi:DNA-binding NarL/FixJ family response regulator
LRYGGPGRRGGGFAFNYFRASMSESHHLLIADDHPLVRQALEQAIRSELPGTRFSEAASLDETLVILDRGEEVDLLLLDLNMPGMQGFSGLFYIRSAYPHVAVVMISANESESVVRHAVDYGAAGFIPKSAPIDTIRTAIRALLRGERWVPDPSTMDAPGGDPRLAAQLNSLTRQQLRVLMLLTEGKLNKQIAYELDITEATVKAHVSAILQKLDVSSRTQAVILAQRLRPDDIGDPTPGAP